LPQSRHLVARLDTRSAMGQASHQRFACRRPVARLTITWKPLAMETTRRRPLRAAAQQQPQKPRQSRRWPGSIRRSRPTRSTRSCGRIQESWDSRSEHTRCAQRLRHGDFAGTARTGPANRTLRRSTCVARAAYRKVLGSSPQCRACIIVTVTHRLYPKQTTAVQSRRLAFHRGDLQRQVARPSSSFSAWRLAVAGLSRQTLSITGVPRS
jgi:hypothetical protein